MGKKKMTSAKSMVMPTFEELSGAWDELIAEEDASVRRAKADLAGPPSGYEVNLAAALNHLVDWTRAGKFRAHNEEDVQCFIYHALVLQFGDATRIRTKRSLGSPRVAVRDETVGGMHFPDLIIGESDDDPDAIYIELKVRAQARKAFHQACLADVKKLAKHHDTHRQFFILFDCDPKVVYLSAAQSNQLHDAAGKGCSVWHYPYELNEDAKKAAAAKAIATMIERGLDLKALGKSNAKKAAKTKLSNALAALAAAKTLVGLSSVAAAAPVQPDLHEKLAPRHAKPTKLPKPGRAADATKGGKVGEANTKQAAQPEGATWR